MVYLFGILIFFSTLLDAQSALSMKNVKIYYEDTQVDLSGSISYCADGRYLNDIISSMMGFSSHQYQTGVWSYNPLTDELKQTMYIAKDVQSGKIVEDYRSNPALSTTLTTNIKKTFYVGSVNLTTRIIEIDNSQILNCSR
ncbi:hypothetical protein [Sulfurimonas sp.]